MLHWMEFTTMIIAFVLVPPGFISRFHILRASTHAKLYSIIPPVRSTPLLYTEKNPIHSTTMHRKAKARHQGIIIHMVAIATKQTILAILGCKKRYFAASEVSQISFDKICNM